VRYEELPEKYAKNRPGHGYISAGFISMMGRDERFRGNGHGTVLLSDALKRYVQASEILAMPIIMLDVLDCGDPERTARRKALYESFGFQSLESHPSRMFIPIQTVRDALAEAYSSEI
jgi:ribosomal protein S18 acetylase RimI-like enzyme